MFFHHTSPSPPPLPSSFIRPSYRSDKKKQSSIAFKATSATSRIAVGFKRFSRIFSKDSKSLPSASYKVSGRVLVVSTSISPIPVAFPHNRDSLGSRYSNGSCRRLDGLRAIHHPLTLYGSHQHDRYSSCARQRRQQDHGVRAAILSHE
jgi:hypothetical protein